MKQNTQALSTNKAAGYWDTLTSSYYWNINLNPLHPQNTTPLLVGYSKKVNQSEAQNKEQLLKRKILNLYNNGYFDRCKSIELFMRVDAIINKKLDPCIIVLYPTHYDIKELNHNIIYKKFGSFLNEFYERIKLKKDLADLLPNTRKLYKSNDDLFKIELYNFANVGQLYTKAANFLRYGHPQGIVEDFINKYKTSKNW